MYDQPELIDGVLDGLTEYYAALGRNAVKLGVDMIRVGDDIGAQQAMMLSPKAWRALAKPRFTYMFDQFRQENPDLFIKIHSCGDYSPILPDEIELGAHLTGLMQPTGGLKDQAAVKAKYGADIAMVGGFDVQRLLPRGLGRGSAQGRARRDQESRHGRRLYLLAVALHHGRRAHPEHLHDAGSGEGLQHLRQVSVELSEPGKPSQKTDPGERACLMKNRCSRFRKAGKHVPPPVGIGRRYGSPSRKAITACR
jgi:hypothetical protein